MGLLDGNPIDFFIHCVANTLLLLQLLNQRFVERRGAQCLGVAENIHAAACTCERNVQFAVDESAVGVGYGTREGFHHVAPPHGGAK